MNTLTKQTVYLPKATFPLSMKGKVGDLFSLQQGYFFTPEQLNEYTQGVIKQALETAADKAQLYRQNSAYKHSKFNLKIEKCLNYNVGIDLETITNTFEETYKKFEV